MDRDPHFWLWEQLGQRCTAGLKRNGFDAHWMADQKSAQVLIHSMIGDYASFGFGGSGTIRQLGIVEALKKDGKVVWDHWQPDLTPEEDMRIRRQQLNCDCFMCSANAIAATGEIVNVDGLGNRTSAMGFGPRRVIIVAGMNKVTPDLASALERVRQVAAPLRAKSLGMATPCAETGQCSDCHSPQRICRITTILHRQPMATPTSVILINEALGY